MFSFFRKVRDTFLLFIARRINFIRTWLPIVSRVFFVIGMVWLTFVSIRAGNTNAPETMDNFFYGGLKIIATPLYFPIERISAWDILFGVLSGGIIYWLMAFLVMKMWEPLWTWLYILPLSDKEYCRAFLASFESADISAWEKLKHSIQFLKKDTFLGSSFTGLSTKQKLDLTMIDPMQRNKANCINAYFGEGIGKPYFKSMKKIGNRTEITVFRPSGFKTIHESEFDSNAFLQAIDLEPTKYKLQIENKTDIIFTIQELSPKTETLPFDEVLEVTRTKEICLGEDTKTREFIFDPIVAWDNISKMLIWSPWMGKTSLLISWIIELFERNHGRYQYYIWSSKPDMMFFSGLDDVVQCVDTVEGNVKMVEFILGEIERRKKLFREANVGSIIEYNEKFPATRLPVLFLIQDEIADILKRISLEYEEGKEVQKAFERNLRILATTARSYGVVQYVSLQSSLLSIFGEQWAEFRDTFNILAFNVGRKAVLTSIFGDQQSGADTLEPFHAVYFDRKKRGYITVQTPMIDTRDKESFLKRNEHRKAQSGEGEEAYIQYAEKIGQLWWKDAQAFQITERQYREICKKLQEEWRVLKLKNNTLVFQKVEQRQKQPIFDNLRKLKKITENYQKKTQNTPENTQNHP